jgi:hypothetical protein
MRRLLCIAGFSALLLAAPANATIKLGQTAPSGASFHTCGPSSGALIQPTVTSGLPYTMPVAGRITSWSTAANGTSNQALILKIFRPVGGASYRLVAHDGARALTPSSLNTFPTSLQVKAGDIIGVDAFATPNAPVGCTYDVSGDSAWTSFPSDPDEGDQAVFTAVPNTRVNASVQLDPSSAFSFAGTTRNKKKGQATTSVSLPGSGTVAIDGTGLTAQARHADGGTVALGVIPNKKTRKRLLAKGKARVTASVTFTPDGGTANTQSQPVKLILR